MNTIKDEMDEMQPGEIRAILLELVQSMEDAIIHAADEEQGVGVERALQLWKTRVEEARKRRKETDENQKHIHIAFSLSDAGLLKVTLSQLGIRLENTVMAFNELFSIGPLIDWENTEGQDRRRNWLLERFQLYNLDQFHNQQQQIGYLIDQIGQIPDNKSIIIWCANNAHEQAGLRFVMYLLREREQPIRVVNVSEMHKRFSSEVPAPYATGLISREIFLKMMGELEQNIPVQHHQRRRYESEWSELSRKGDTLRVWDNEEIRGLAEDGLDEAVLQAIRQLQENETGNGFIKAGRVVAKVLETFPQALSAQFIEYRIWRLISDGDILFKGLPGAMNLYSVKLA